MKFAIFILVILLNKINSFGQIEDLYQSSIIYKKNKIKSRIIMYDYNKYHTKMVDMFDTNGLVTEHIKYDTTGRTICLKVKVEYDTNLLIKRELMLLYQKYDSSKKIITNNIVPDSFFTEYFYDSLKYLSKKLQHNALGQKTVESIITINPFTITAFFFRNDTLKNKIFNEFSVPYVAKKMIYTIISADGKEHLFIYTYKNHFNKMKNILSREVGLEIDNQEKTVPAFYFKDESYQYMPNGLLLNKTMYNPSNHSDLILRYIFDYKFRD